MAENVRQGRPPLPVPLRVVERPGRPTWPGDIHLALVHAVHHHVLLGVPISPSSAETVTVWWSG